MHCKQTCVQQILSVWLPALILNSSIYLSAVYIFKIAYLNIIGGKTIKTSSQWNILVLYICSKALSQRGKDPSFSLGGFLQYSFRLVLL